MKLKTAIYSVNFLITLSLSAQTLQVKTCGEYPNNTYGYEEKINEESSKEIIACKFTWADEFRDNFAVVELNKKPCFIDLKGNLLKEGLYSEIYGVAVLKQYYAVVKKGNQYGFLDSNLNEISSTFYIYQNKWDLNFDGPSYANDESNACVIKDGKAGVINIATNKVVLPFKYEKTQTIGYYADKVYLVKEKGKSYFSNDKGVKLNTEFYDEFLDEWVDFYVMLKKEKWIFVNKKTFKEHTDITKFVQTDITPQSITRSFYKNDKAGFINTKGDLVIDFKYERAEDFDNNGQARVIQNGKMGIINLKGKWVIEPKYDEIDSYSFNGKERWARIKLNEKYGYIDTLGNEKVKPEYDYLSFSFCGGITSAEKNKKFGILDSSGKLILPIEYDGMTLYCYCANKAIAKKINDKILWGYCDKTGKIIIDFMYEEVNGYNKFNLACVKQNGYYGYIDKLGKVVIPFEYSSIDEKTMNRGYTLATKNGVEVRLYPDGTFKNN